MSETPHVTDQLKDYIAERLDIATIATVEAHLRDCEECRQQYIAQSQSHETAEPPPAEATAAAEKPAPEVTPATEETPASPEPPAAPPEVESVKEVPLEGEIPSGEEMPAEAESPELLTEEQPIAEELPAEVPEPELVMDAQTSPTKRSLQILAIFVVAMIVIGAGLGFLWNSRQSDLPPPVAPPPPAPEVVEAPPPMPAAETPVQAPVAETLPAPLGMDPLPASEPAAVSNPAPVAAKPAPTKPATIKPPAKAPPVKKPSKAAVTPYIENVPSEEIPEKKKASGKKTEEKGGVKFVPEGNPFSSGDLPEWKGTVSGIKTRRTIAVKTANEWEALWKAHTLSQTPAPKVDFENFMIVGIYLGEKPSGGYAVELLNTEEDYPPAMIVTYREITPTSGTDDVVTQPFHLWVIPQSTLPVKFKRQ